MNHTAVQAALLGGQDSADEAVSAEVLQSEIERLQAENARLRAALDAAEAELENIISGQ